MHITRRLQTGSYEALYEHFDSALARQIRQEAYGKDIGQHSWVTAEELQENVPQLRLSRSGRLLDLGCVASLLLGSGFVFAYYPAFWSMPTMILSKSAAAATFGLINSVGQLGGLAGPWAIGALNDRTQSLTASFGFIALAYLSAGILLLGLRVEDPIHLAAETGKSPSVDWRPDRP